MKAMKLGLCVVLVSGVAVGASGCFFPSTLTDLISGGMKVASGEISTLTGSEIMALNGTAIAVINENTGSTLEPLTVAQADALAAFFAANTLNTPEDFEELATQAEQDPSQIEGLDALGAAFDDIDPDNLDAQGLDDLFNSVFGGTGPGG